MNATAIINCWTVYPFRWYRNQFMCAYCDDTFTDCALLRNHVRACAAQHSVKDIYKKFKEMGLINVDTTDAVCRLCSLKFTSVTDMKSHVTLHEYEFDSKHPEGILPFELNKEAWSCVICCEQFNNFLKLYEHMNIHYQYYICAICGKGYMTAPRLRKHSEAHITGSFPCNDCGKVFPMRSARESHRASAHRGPRYECPVCKIRFDGYYERMKHLNEEHHERKVSYKCRHCELSFGTSAARAKHARSVHFPAERECRCPHCEWQFKTPYELKRHLVKHTGERNFHCGVCGKSFPRSRALRSHLETHAQRAKLL